MKHTQQLIEQETTILHLRELNTKLQAKLMLSRRESRRLRAIIRSLGGSP